MKQTESGSSAITPSVVDAAIFYFRPGGAPVNRRFVAPGAELNTGAYDPYTVKMRNARLENPAPSLSSHGFQLINHVSAISDFEDKARVDALYPNEVNAAICATTGADFTIPLSRWRVRTSGSTGVDMQPPAVDAHVDLTEEKSIQTAKRLLHEAGRSDYAYRRFLITSFWRAFSPPPQDYPLAVCQGSSVRDDEGETNILVMTDKLPVGDEAYAPLEDEDNLFAATIFSYNPNHRWFYYPNMTLNEALVVTFYDSAGGRNWRTPHASFKDESINVDWPRQSIEMRTIAYFS